MRNISGRFSKRRVLATGAVTASLAALVLATEVPSVLLPTGGGSAALAELIARSPGVRVGGVALKAKQPRAALAGVPAKGAPGRGDTAVPTASVLPAAGPEGVVPGPGAVGPGGFPADFTAPAVPDNLAGIPGTGSTGGAPDFGSFPGPGGGGIPIFVPGSGGGSGGGGGGTTPNPGETPPVTPVTPPTGGTGLTPPPVPEVVPGIPEPSTWAMLIFGFGVIGGALRRRGRAAIA